MLLVAECYENRDKLRPYGPLKLVCRLNLDPILQFLETFGFAPVFLLDLLDVLATQWPNEKCARTVFWIQSLGYKSDLAVLSVNCEVTLNDAAHFSPAHSMTEPNMEALCETNGDLNDSDEITINCAESEKCTHTQNDKVIRADVDQVNSTKTSTPPKEINFIPYLQSSSNCAEQSSFNGPCTRSTNLLMEDNGLEVAYDRNSVNNGGRKNTMREVPCVIRTVWVLYCESRTTTHTSNTDASRSRLVQARM
ncbi:hypothetical protein ACROYT_G029983 [Oculina patagonica]